MTQPRLPVPPGTAAVMGRRASLLLAWPSACEIQVCYAIGVAEPTSISLNTFGTGKISDDKIVKLVREIFDLRPCGIIAMLDLLHADVPGHCQLRPLRPRRLQLGENRQGGRPGQGALITTSLPAASLRRRRQHPDNVCPVRGAAAA